MKVPKLRFKEFTDQWQTKTLGEVFEILSGTTPSRAILGYFGGEFNWVKTTDLNNSLINDTQEKVTDRALSETSLRVLPKGTVLIAMYGGFNQIGRTGLLTRNAAINQALSALLPKLELVHPYFLLNYLNYRVDDWKSFAASSRKDPNITKNDVKNFTFIFPTLNEQTKIANFLTAIDEKIAQLTQKCDLLAQYKKGVMQQIFSQKLRFKDDDGREFPEWKIKFGNEVFDSVSDKNHNSNLPILAISQEYGAIPREMIDYNISVTDQSIENYKVVQVGDFIISLRSFQGGIEYSAYKGICSPAYIILRPSIEINKIFFMFYMKTESFIKELNRNIEGIRDGKLISYKYFSEIPLPFPSLPEQTKIANFLTAIDNKITQAQTQLEAVKRYKKGLLQQMFV
ncbi:MAG: restriction endonuclease subunit S [Gammaproteobacteria bacterium]|nr:MAG: restriction endonuclease subunit S [Gammaproteobacteria bacterium]